MSLDDIAMELAIDDCHFRKHCAMLHRMRLGTAQEVVQYLYGCAIFLTAAQAKALFAIIFPKVTSSAGNRYSVRSQLVMALHCFCVEPYILWEDDGERECIWTNMTYEGLYLWETGLCADLAGRSAGEVKSWGKVPDDSCKGGCGFWPEPGPFGSGYCSLCAAGRGPEYPGGRRPESVLEARRVLRQDVSGLRASLKELRISKDRQLAFELLTPPFFYGNPAFVSQFST
jgi:hypothetical protein